MLFVTGVLCARMLVRGHAKQALLEIVGAGMHACTSDMDAEPLASSGVQRGAVELRCGALALPAGLTYQGGDNTTLLRTQFNAKVTPDASAAVSDLLRGYVPAPC